MKETEEKLNFIAQCIQESGLDPHDQLLGYLTTGDVTYITRRNKARELIETVKKEKIEQFIKELKK